MDAFELAWRSIGTILGIISGVKLVIISLENRTESIQAGLDYPREQIFTQKMYRRIFLIIVLAFIAGILFSFEAAFLGVLVGLVIGVLLRNRWRIVTSRDPESSTEPYPGD